MLPKKVKNRILFFILSFTITVILVFFILQTLNKNILYFATPTEINLKEDLNIQKKMRIGGMVKKNSIKTNSENILFIVTDNKNEIIVSYSGTVPNLFAEGKGVVAEGKFRDKKFFIAERILAKHDENYMPPELKKALENDAK